MNEKDYKNLRIIFMGTPDFAVASLEVLLKNKCNIVAVVTAPDKPAGRGMELQQSPVKKFALQNDIYVLQPEKLKSPDFINSLRSLQADLQICVAFRMLPEIVWNMPPMGTINLHGSLLPQYRGAAPINWAIINGEKTTGVTTFKLQHAIDTGNILLQESFPIDEDDTAGTIHDKMKMIGAQLLMKTIKCLTLGNIQEKPQSKNNYEALHEAPKIFTETCQIDFNKSTDAVYNLIRGLSPFPTAFTFLHGKKLKIFKALKDKSHKNLQPGELITDGKTHLSFGCTDGAIQVLEVQLEGKKRMPITEFLKGYRF